MRMYGPTTALFARDVQKDNYICNVPILKGTYVNIQHLGNHYDEKYFP